jgi:hypothetical protein
MRRALNEIVACSLLASLGGGGGTKAGFFDILLNYISQIESLATKTNQLNFISTWNSEFFI